MANKAGKRKHKTKGVEATQMVFLEKMQFLPDHEKNDGMLKVEVVKGETSKLLPPEGSQAMPTLDLTGMIVPPYRMTALISVWENSSVLPQAIEAMARNVDGFGYRLQPVLDFTAEDIDELVADVIIEEGDSEEPTEAEVAKRKKELRKEAKAEHRDLNNFLGSAALDRSFTQLRMDTRQDFKLLGNAYWEVLRRKSKKIYGFKRGDGETFRISTETEEIEVEIPYRKGVLEVGTEKIRRRFRRFVQIDRRSFRTTWFKEFGDPRVMSCVTGKFEEEEGGGAKKGSIPEDEKANEIIHFKEFSKGTPYGKPSWIGALLPVLGIRQAEEINYDYFDNKVIPPALILVSGGKISGGQEGKLEDYMEDRLAGTENFHRLLVLEATPDKSDPMAAQRGQVRIHFQPLTPFQQKDGLFLEYSEKSRESVESVFRIPRLFLGRIRDFNRATAEVAKAIGEEQVFSPERQAFDDMMNHLIFPALGVRFWRFKSKGVPVKDPFDLVELGVKLAAAGLAAPHEIRGLVEEVLQENLERLPAIQGKVPVKVIENLARVAGPIVLKFFGVTEEDVKEAGLDGVVVVKPPAVPGAAPGGAAGEEVPTAADAIGTVIDGGLFMFPQEYDDPEARQAKNDRLSAKLREIDRKLKERMGPLYEELFVAPEELGASVLRGSDDGDGAS